MKTCMGRIAVLLTAALILSSCGLMEDLPKVKHDPFEDTGILVKGDTPVTIQKLAGGWLPLGLYRYVDTEAGTVVYIAKQDGGSVSIAVVKGSVKGVSK